MTQSHSDKPAEIRTCPICKRALPVPAPKEAPFCGDRCKLIDLGRWLNGSYQIPVRQTDPDDRPPE